MSTSEHTGNGHEIIQVGHVRCQIKLSVTYIKLYSWEELLQKSNRFNRQPACSNEDISHICSCKSDPFIKRRLGCWDDSVTNCYLGTQHERRYSLQGKAYLRSEFRCLKVGTCYFLGSLVFVTPLKLKLLHSL